MLSTLSIAAITLGGCAGVVSNDQLQQSTSFAIGLDQSDFTIYNKSASGIKTMYSVKTKSGQEYNCYVTSVAGGLFPGGTSDALCNKKGEVASNPLLHSSY
jgi:hypothetical protein